MPASPPATLTSVVTFSSIITGDIAAFDSQRYKINLASILPGVEPDDISLALASASVAVTATIKADGDVADGAVSAINSLDASTLSGMIGFSVESFSGPTVETFATPSSPAPPSSLPTSDTLGLRVERPGEATQPETVIGVVAAVLVVGALAVVLGQRYRKARLRRSLMLLRTTAPWTKDESLYPKSDGDILTVSPAVSGEEMVSQI